MLYQHVVFCKKKKAAKLLFINLSLLHMDFLTCSHIWMELRIHQIRQKTNNQNCTYDMPRLFRDFLEPMIYIRSKNIGKDHAT